MKSILTMADKLSYRWAFKTSSWSPSEADLLLASSCIQPEEKNRISKFVFKQDFKSSLIGRLMLRKFASITSGITYSKIVFQRDNHGKPILDCDNVDFNISHQGDYVVLAGEVGNKRIGIDVMNNVAPAGKNIPEFFRLMKRQFSPMEWENILSYNTQEKQLSSFYRHWCLKESYVKNIGVGITVNLQDISFEIKTKNLSQSVFVTDTDLMLQGSLLEGWVFEETLLDASHNVAVAISLNGEQSAHPQSFQLLTFDEVMTGSYPLAPQDLAFYQHFVKIEEKPF